MVLMTGWAVLVRRVVQAREAVKNGGIFAAAADADAKERSRRPRKEVSNMEDYDDEKTRRCGCIIM